VPKRLYTIEDLRLNRIAAENLLSPKDNSLNYVRQVAQVRLSISLVAAQTMKYDDHSYSKVL
jgi:hypothetical protein